jgi:uncharacterized protein (DUF1501 family)
MLSRRQFLGRTAGASFLTLSGVAPDLFVRAADAAQQADRNNHVLVVIFLDGGNDGLNTVIPFENRLYYKNRPSLGVPKGQVIKLSDQVGLHPSMARAGELFKAGKLAVVQGVGYPQPNRSHFRSREIWHTASPAGRVPTTGWLGRVLDYQFRPDDQKLRGLALTEALPQSFQAQKLTVPVAAQFETFGDTADGSPQQKLLRRISSTPSVPGPAASFLSRQAATTYRTAEALRQAAARYKSSVEYSGGELGGQLRRAAEVITADLGVRLLFLSQTGYDSHGQQAATQPPLLGELANGLAAFQEDLEKQRAADRVVVMVFSEFGRRVSENASQGTDHGAASVMFLTGTPVKGGLAGSYPRLDQLDDGDLIHTVDFRSVYATLLEKWLGCRADKILGQSFPLVDLVKG